MNLRHRLFLFSNIQNLFDAAERGGKYDDYCVGRWDGQRYAERLAEVGAMLREVQPDGTDVIALQKVDNRNIELDLRNYHLTDLGYDLLFASPNHGFEVTLMLALVVRVLLRHVPSAMEIPPKRLRCVSCDHGATHLTPSYTVRLINLHG